MTDPDLAYFLDRLIGRARERLAMRQGMPGRDNELLALELECVVRGLEERRDDILAEQSA